MALQPRVFLKRAMTTVIGGLAVFFLVFFPPLYVFEMLLLVLAVLAVFEFNAIAKGFSQRIFLTPTVLFLVLGFLAHHHFLPLAFLPYLAVLLASLWSLYSTKFMKNSLPVLGMTLVAMAYVGFSFFSLVGIFRLSWEGQSDFGRHLLLFYLALVWSGDSAAYILGSVFGKHKISPTISPNKSWEGTLGHFAGVLLAGFLGRHFFFPMLGVRDVIVLSAVFSLFGFWGDLVESSWKRGSDIKDSGHLLPGHGGILDRVDSIYLTAPIFWWFFAEFSQY
jgi:phosphatidate cytidylyltransferase